MAFAFFLCVVQGPSPAFDLTTARDRVIGILLGNMVSYLVLAHVWPASVSRRIDPAIAALLRRLGAMVTTTNPMARRISASQSQAALGAIEVDIRLARYEPANVRPSPDWLTARRATAHQIGALESPLLLADSQHVEATTQIAGRLEALADRLAAGEAVVAAPGERPRTESGRFPLFEMIDGCLDRVEQGLARATFC